MLSALCIRRPVMTILVMASFVIAGIFGYKQLPVAAVPRVDFPTIQVQAQLPGAAPETMAASVASILERQFSNIAGVTAMTSTSSLGNTSIVLQFDLNRNIDGAALDVQTLGRVGATGVDLFASLNSVHANDFTLGPGTASPIVFTWDRPSGTDRGESLPERGDDNRAGMQCEARPALGKPAVAARTGRPTAADRIEEVKQRGVDLI